jgi:hypothetical protein
MRLAFIASQCKVFVYRLWLDRSLVVTEYRTTVKFIRVTSEAGFDMIDISFCTPMRVPLCSASAVGSQMAVKLSSYAPVALYPGRFLVLISVRG